MFPVDRVGAGCIDDADVFQNGRLGGDDLEGTGLLFAGRFSPPDQVDRAGGRRHSFRQQRFPQEPIDDSALAGV